MVSPILIGEEGLKELETVTWVLDLCNVKINDSCGFHVHIDAATTIGGLRQVFDNQRYYKVNLEAYNRHQTVEFRQHSGTINYTKMEKWIHFLNGLITFAHTGFYLQPPWRDYHFWTTKRNYGIKYELNKWQDEG